MLNRIHVRSAALGGLVAAFISLGGWTASGRPVLFEPVRQQDTLRIDVLEIVDEAGRTRVRLSGGAEAGVQLWDEAGALRAQLIQAAGATGLVLYGTGPLGLLHVVATDAGAGLTVHDDRGGVRIALSTEGGDPGLALYRDTGLKDVMLRQSSQGGLLALTDARGRIRAVLPADLDPNVE